MTSRTTLSAWVAEFLTDERRRDVRRKLASSGSEERHAFLIVGALAKAGFQVQDLMMRHDPPLPVAAPKLPPEVTHVWVMSMWTSGRGMCWSPGSGWEYFDKHAPAA